MASCLAYIFVLIGPSTPSQKVVPLPRYYDTDHVELWRRYSENMNQSSIWWGTVYATRNLSAIAKEGPLLHDMYQPGSVPAVSWWQVGDEVLGMSEWPSGDRVDVHSMVNLGGYNYQEEGNFLGDGFSNEHSAAHEQYEEGNSLEQ